METKKKGGIDVEMPLQFLPKPCLTDIDDAQPWLKDNNPHILHFYRVDYEVRDVLRSFLQWHNETLNIHTHFLPGVAFVVVLLLSFVYPPKWWPQTMSIAIVLWIWFVGCLSCLFSSTVYHWWSCYSEKTYERTVCADFVGIMLTICFSYYPSLLLAFQCHVFYRNLYMWIITVPSVIVIGAQFAPKSITKHRAFEIVRLSAFVLLTVFGFVPLIHWIVIMGGFGNVSAIMNMYRIVFLLILYGIGFLLYLTKFPECVFPGKWSSILHSHSLWHVFVALALAWTLYASVLFYDWREKNPC